MPVPSLILQPLVENAVRHGRGSDGIIDLVIRITSRGDEVLIAIADKGPGMPSGYRIETGRGVGLRNVDERLRRSHDPTYRLEIRANEPQGTVVIVRIPTEEPDSAVRAGASSLAGEAANTARGRQRLK